jgi:hypothetical protein
MPTSQLLSKDIAAARGTDEDDSNEVTAVFHSSSPIKHEYEHATLPFGNEAATKTDELEGHDLDSKPSASAADDSVPSPVKKVSTFEPLLLLSLRLSIGSRALFIALFSFPLTHRGALKVHLLLPQNTTR